MKPRPASRLAYPLAFAIATMLAAQSVHAGQIWDGGGADNNWNTAANWDSNALPTFTSAITFTGNTRNGAVNNLIAASTIGGINLTNDGSSGKTNAFTLSGNSITLGGNITTTANTAGSTITDIISLAMILNGNRTITTNQQSASVQHNLTISGIISETGGARNLTKAGAGVLALTGANSYTGTTTLSGGTLDLGGGTANGSLSSATLTLAGGSFNYTRTGNTTQGFTTTNINAGGASQISVVSGNTLNLGTVTRGAGGALDFGSVGAGTVAALAASNVNGIMAGFTFGNSWAVANGAGVAISGLGSYTLSSVAGTTATSYLDGNIDVDDSPGALDASFTANSLRFSSAAANTLTLTGATNILTSGGILVGSGVGSNLSTITGGTLAGANTKDLSIIQNNASGGLTISSVIANNTGATALTKSGAGLLTLSGNNSFTGGVFIHGGQLTLANAGALNSTTPSNVTFGPGSTGKLTLGGNNLTIPVLNTDSNAPGTTVIENASATDITLTVGNASSSTFAGVIQNGTGTGKLALTKTGAGTLILSGANTYTGGTTLSGGTVVISNATSLGGGNVLVTGSSRINATGGIAYANAIDVGAAFTMQNPNVTTSTATFSGVLSGAGNLSLPNAGTNGVDGVIAFTNTANTFTGNVILSGSGSGNEIFSFKSIGDGGNFTLAKNGNSQGITYTGDSNITFNTRQINIASTMVNYGTRQGLDGGGSNPVSRFENNGAGTVTVNTNMAMTSLATDGVLYFNGTNTGNNTFAGTIADPTGTGKLWIGKLGTGTWLMTGDNTYEGGTIIANGTLSVGKIENAASAQPLGKGSIIQFGVGSNSTSGTLAFTGSTNSITDKQVVVGAMSQGNGTGTGSILSNGTGTLSFSNANFNPTISGNVVSGTTTTAVTVTRTLTLGGTNTGANEIQGIIQNNNGATGPVALTKTGTGTWVLSGANTYTGNTLINAGVLLANNANAIPSGSALSMNGDGAILGLASGDFTRLPNGNTLAAGKITFFFNGGFAAYGADRTVNFGGASGIVAIGSTATANIGSLNGKILILGASSATHKVTVTNTLDFGNASRTIQVDNGAATVDAEISGVLQPQSGGTAGLNKTGEGALLLSSVSNTLNGPINVNAGKLIVNGNVSTSVLTTVKSGATLGGSGTVGALTIDSGGFFSPGNSPGIETVAGNYIQNGTLQVEIEGLTAGNGAGYHDRVDVTGTVTLGGALSLLTFTGTYVANDLIFILLNDSNDAISGTFTGLAEGAVIGNYGGYDWKISYLANGDSLGSPSFTGGNDIALMAVPEPRAALLGGLGLIALLRRRR